MVDKMLKKITLLLFLSLLFAQIVAAKNNEWMIFNTKNTGIPSCYFHSFLIDAVDKLWLATDCGLAKFDRKIWTIYNNENSTLPDESIQCISIDSNGNLWLLTTNHLIKNEEKNWVAFNYDTLELDNRQPRTLSIDEDDNIWFGVDNALVKFDNTNFNIYPKDNFTFSFRDIYINDIETDKSGNVWFTTSDNKLIKYDGLKWVTVAENVTTGDIAIDHHQNIWFFVFDESRKLIKYNGHQLQEINNFPHVVRSLIIDNDDKLLINTFEGLFIFDGEKYAELPIPIPKDYYPESVRLVTLDKSNNLWLNINDYGLLRYDGTVWKIYHQNNYGLPSDDISSIIKDKKNITWIGTGGGLVNFDGKNWAVYNMNNSIVENGVNSLSIDEKGKIWIGTGWEGLLSFNGKEWQNYDIGKPYNNIQSVACNRKGNVWFSVDCGIGGCGLFQFDGKSFKWFKTDNSPLPSNSINTICFDSKSCVWLATMGGLVKFDGQKWQLFNSGNSPLPYDYIHTLAIDTRDNIWLGTLGHVIKFDGTNWISYNYDNCGLPGWWINAIIIDSKDNKWIGTDKGLANFNNKEWKFFNKKNSPLPDDNINALFHDSKGNLWIGTHEGGLTIYNENGVLLGE